MLIFFKSRDVIESRIHLLEEETIDFISNCTLFFLLLSHYFAEQNS